jgi:hypothetical protein
MNRVFTMIAGILIMVFACPGGAGAESSLRDPAYWQAVAIARHGEPRWYARQLHLATPTSPRWPAIWTTGWIEISAPGPRKDHGQPRLPALARPQSLLGAGAASPLRQTGPLLLADSLAPGLAPGPRAPGPAFLSSILTTPISPSIRLGEEAVIVGVRGSF